MEEKYIPTTYTIQTTDIHDANLAINANKLAGALYNVISWKSALYNDKTYDVLYLYDGKLYTAQEFFKIEIQEGKEVKTVLTEDMIIRKLDELISNVETLVWDNYV